MEEKKYKVLNKNNKEAIMTHREVAELMLSGSFMAMFNRLKIGEKMFNHDIMSDFERIQ